MHAYTHSPHITYTHSVILQDGTPAVELMPDTKIKADKGSAEGTFFLPKSGQIQVTFDNSYSIFRYEKCMYVCMHVCCDI